MLIAFVATWALSFLLTILGLNRIPYATLTALRILIAVLFLLPFFLKRSFHLKFSKADWLDFSLLALFGVVLAQLFQVIYRYSYAPPATNVLFLLNLAPAIILVLSAFVLSERMTFPKVIGVAMGVLGMVSILANWERPSTFSPFSRYPKEEMFILLAAFCWALFTVHARKVLKRHDPITVTYITLGLSLIPVLILAMARDGLKVIQTISSADWLVVLLLGVVCTAVAYLLWYHVLTEVEASKAGASLLLTPVFLTALMAVERRIGFFGTSPIVVVPVITGIILILAGVGVTWLMWLSKEKMVAPLLVGERQFILGEGWLGKTLIFFAAGSLILAVIAFFLPIKVNHIQGVLLNDAIYESEWRTNGYDSIGGYLLLLMGATNVIAALRYLRRRYDSLQLLGWAGFSALLLLSVRFAGDTVFFSWTPWIPVEIQHAIGTEYVRIWKTAVTNVPMLLSSTLAIAYVFMSGAIAAGKILRRVKESKPLS